ncbi:hypothetical protein B0H17DRAFT_1136511 [Mycena rosella]|uniref:Uncharacterized protein n=1 Tax=Mycena rosella TaxID=1033263 RepID=A0AAD7DB07_MYCRO|nr:hypothetical protein B0H17DRAFT_1136511 [Mycena rosella]
MDLPWCAQPELAAPVRNCPRRAVDLVGISWIDRKLRDNFWVQMMYEEWKTPPEPDLVPGNHCGRNYRARGNAASKHSHRRVDARQCAAVPRQCAAAAAISPSPFTPAKPLNLRRSGRRLAEDWVLLLVSKTPQIGGAVTRLNNTHCSGNQIL